MMRKTITLVVLVLVMGCVAPTQECKKMCADMGRVPQWEACLPSLCGCECGEETK